MSITEFLNTINGVILNPLISLLFGIAFIVFLVGIFKFISSDATSDARGEGKKKIFFGLFGMFIMFSAYGLIRLILGTFGIDGPDYLGL